jgi:hypothetical protein
VTKAETQSERIGQLEGEVSALRLARKYLSSAIKGKSVNLSQMRASLNRMKALGEGKERYDSYKEKVARLKRKIVKSNEQMLQEELNEMELKGKI